LTRLAAFFPIILVSISITFGASPVMAMVARRFGLIDVPRSEPHKNHSKPTPLVGGLVILVGIVGSMLICAIPRTSTLYGMLFWGAMIAGFGMLDNRYSLPPFAKLMGQILSFLVLWFFEIQIRIFPQQWLNSLLTAFWIIGMTNAFNFIDSMDGLAIGLAEIAAAFFLLVAIDAGQLDLAYLTATILGSCAGFYFYNAQPSTLFLGDSGSQLLGLLLAAIAVEYRPIGLRQGVSWFTPILVLGVPIFDMVLVVVSRIRRGAPIYLARLDHTYHRLRRLGMDARRSVIAMQMVAVGLGLIGFILLDATVIIANLIFSIIVLAGSIVIAVFEHQEKAS